MTQQPHLALWVGVIALLKVASESYALQMLFTSPIPASDKLSSIICSHVLLPAVNLTMGLLYVSLLDHLDPTPIPPLEPLSSLGCPVSSAAMFVPAMNVFSGLFVCKYINHLTPLPPPRSPPPTLKSPVKPRGPPHDLQPCSADDCECRCYM